MSETLNRMTDLLDLMGEHEGCYCAHCDEYWSLQGRHALELDADFLYHFPHPDPNPPADYDEEN